MAYYFMVEKKKGQYEALDIDSMFNNNHNKKYSKIGAYTLQEIDMFTTQFENELELRETLFQYNVLSLEYIKKPLSTRWVSKGVYNKVPYDFLYQKDIDLIIEPTKLVELIMKRYYNNDFVFIKKFAEYFSGYHDCATTAPEVRMYADMAIRDNISSKYLDEYDMNNNNMVLRLIKLLLFEYYENPNGYIDYKNKIKYRNLHTIIAFINNYDAKYSITHPKEKVEFDILPTQENINAKKRIRKKEEVEGQISLFDMLDDDKK